MSSWKTGLTIETFEASAILGRQIGYSDVIVTIDEVKVAMAEAVGKVEGFTFSGTLTETAIFAVGPWGTYEEPAVLLTSSIYPRFPVERETFRQKFTESIGHLATLLKQERVAVQFSDMSFMLETEHCKEPDIK